MATISTSQTFDSAARSAGEAFTINSGAVFTIDSDTRDGKNAAAARAGSMGAFTMTAATGGRVLIDGRNVWVIDYDGLIGGPNVPALGTIIAGVTSGATGELMNCSASISATPTAAGAAMPATGIFKLKNVSGTFQDNETLEIQGSTDLCLANGIGRRGWIEVIMDDAATFTIGRAQKFEVRGDWYYLTNTSGSRGQQIQCPNYGGANTFIPGVWIETGVGTDAYEFWPACLAGTGSPWATANLGTDARSKFVQCLASGIIRIGSDGTNNIGDLPASGCKVRIPNVYLMSAATASRASNSVPNGTLATRPDFTTTNAGQIDVDKALGHWQMNLSQPYSVALSYLALFDQYTIAECATAIVMTEVHNGNYTIAGDTPALVMTSNFAGATITDCKFGRSGTIGSADYGVSLSLCNDFTFDGCYFQNRTLRSNAAAYTANFSQCANLELIDCVTVGSGIQLSTCSSPVVTSLLYADAFVGTSSGTNAPVGAVMAVAYTSNLVMSGFGYYTAVANVHPDTCALYLSAAQGVKFRNVGTRASPLTGGSSNAMLYAVNDAGNSLDIKIQRVYFDLLATTFYNAVNSTKNVRIENCSGNNSVGKNLVSAALNQDIRNAHIAGIAPASTASIYGSIFYHHFTSASAGRLGIVPSEPTAEYAPYVTTNFTTSATGTSGFNSSNGVALINSGDYVIFEFPYTIKGIDSLQNVAPTVTTATNMTTEYQIDTGSGWSSWKTFNATNLSGETVDEVAGFRFKIRITASATNAANIVTVLYCLTNSNGAAQDIQYPLDTVTLTLTGLSSGSDVVVLQAGTETVRSSADAVSSFSYTYETPESVDIAVYKSGYIPYFVRAYALSSADASLPIAQVVDRAYLA